MKEFLFSLSGTVNFAEGSASFVGVEIKKKNLKKVLIVTDKGIVMANLLEQIVKSLNENMIEVVIYDSVEANPNTAMVCEGVKMYLDNHCEGMIAVGGGSSIDCAKAIGIIISNGGSIEDYRGFNLVKKPIPYLIAVPTTYGTGSEVSIAAVITNESEKFKMLIMSDLIAPSIALIDPKLLVALPYTIAASTGLDALTHAIESYVSKYATPFSDALNEYAISTIFSNILPAATTNDDIKATSNMVVASCMTAVAFNYTALGLVHAIAHSLGGLCNIAHGVANALLLPYVMEFNFLSKPKKFKKIATLIGSNIDGLNETEAAKCAITKIRMLIETLNIPENLRAIGIQKSDLPRIAQYAYTDGNIGYNPRTVKEVDIVNILKEVY